MGTHTNIDEYGRAWMNNIFPGIPWPRLTNLGWCDKIPPARKKCKLIVHVYRNRSQNPTVCKCVLLVGGFFLNTLGFDKTTELLLCVLKIAHTFLLTSVRIIRGVYQLFFLWDFSVLNLCWMFLFLECCSVCRTCFLWAFWHFFKFRASSANSSKHPLSAI